MKLQQRAASIIQWFCVFYNVVDNSLSIASQNFATKPVFSSVHRTLFESLLASGEHQRHIVGRPEGHTVGLHDLHPYSFMSAISITRSYE